MPEIKHTFQGGKMNRDLDERLVPNGQYRNAMNIQVRTTDDPDSDGGESGSVQNLKGNSLIGESYYSDWHNSGTTQNPQKSKCVGSVADEKNDKAYFFFASALHPPTWGDYELLSQRLYIDTIIEQGLNGQTTPVVVDIFGIVDNFTGTLGADYDDGQFDVSTLPGGGFSQFNVADGGLYKPGMEIRVVDEYGTNILPSEQSPLKIKAIDSNTIMLHQKCLIDITTSGRWFVFESPRVLNFSPGDFLINPVDNNNLLKNNYITGVNVIDGMIFWTDSYSEPKKINISRCKAGTNVNGINNNFTRPSKLYIKDHISSQYVDANTTDFELDYGGSTLSNGSGIDSYLKEEHLTVIRPAPKTAPTLIMKDGIRERTSPFLSNYVFQGLDEGDPNNITVGTSYSIIDSALYDTNFKKNDILQFHASIQTAGSDTDTTSDDVFDTVQLRAKFISYQQQVTGGTVEEVVDVLNTTSMIKIVIITGGSVTSDFSAWQVNIELKQKPLFETKFGRFGYRYKYSDGEYSTFSPWSELAFLPDKYAYKTDEGYNLGMVNTLRELTIKDFIPYKRPLDVVSIDILYKSTDSPNVLVVETVDKGKSSEWTKFTPDGTPYTSEINTGSLEITSEMIHRTLPSDQILRSWDNVPRFAKAQEIVGNRLVYGNYTQGYNMNDVNINLAQDIVSDSVQSLSPAKSIKSIRSYKIGMVFGDKYGRETPVITSGYTVSDTTDEGYTSLTGDISVPKSMCANKNSFLVTQSWGDPNLDVTPPTVKDNGWIEYVKYYVKETSNEYHNLIMDRWYPSGDKRGDGGFNNIWISFNSADRNKVDEDTYLLLKNANGNDKPVFENARYKVLAIENEAPDFIKTKLNSIGVVGDLNTTNTFLSIWPTMSDTAAANPPSQLWTKSSMEIHSDTWANAGLGPNASASASATTPDVFGKEIKGKLEIRIVGACVSSSTVLSRITTPWKELVHYSRGDGVSGDQVVKLRWDSPWTEVESNMFQKVSDNQALGIDGYTLAQLEYWVEVREAVTENKPEFDGKFFVKIKQDTFTSQNIEYYSVPIGSQVEWSATMASQLFYVHSGYQNQSSVWGDNGHFAQEGFYEFDWSDTTPPAQDANTWQFNALYPQTYPIYSLFFGAFDEWLLPNVDADMNSYFDSAAESTEGPGNTDAADSTSHADSEDCNCIYDIEYYGMGDPENHPNASYIYAYLTSMDLSPFGSCSVNYSTMTRNYWVEFTDKTSTYANPERSGVFIDECQMAYMNIIPGPDRATLFRETGTGADQLPLAGGPLNGNGSWENGKYARPRNGLSKGEGKQIVNGILSGAGASGDDFGNIVLSYVSNNPEDVSTDEVWVAMQEPGTVFKLFGDDRFVVLGIMYRSPKYGDHDSAQKNYSGYYAGGSASVTYPDWAGLGLNNCNFYGSGVGEDTIVRYRHTIYVEFRKLNDAGNVTNQGLNPAFDPRRFARHDGAGSNSIITLLDYTYINTSVDQIDNTESQLQTLTSTNGAVFETEPKSDSNLDIYYEASNAIPMVLNENNVFDFAPIGSKVTALRTVAGNENEIPLTPVRINRRVNNAHFTHEYNEHAIISIMSTDVSYVEELVDDNGILVPSATFGADFLHRNDFTIGDKLHFEHKDGTITQAVIKQLYKPIAPGEDTFTNDAENANNGFIADDIKYGVIGGPKAFEHAGQTSGVTVQLYYGGHNSYTPNTTAGEFLGSESFIISDTGVASSSGGEVEIGDTVTTISYTNSSGSIVTVNFGQSSDSSAPRGVSVIGFEDHIISGKSTMVLSELDPSYSWSEVFEDVIDTGFNSTTITIYFQKNFGYYGVDINVWKRPVKLGWHNCYSFGNGLESDRIRDDFNAPMIDNGVKASTTFSGYKREKISSGLIYSGLYNSKSQVNDLNQFNMAEKITKDLNPTYGSIQALKTRDTDIVVFAEDKILKVLANKDALFNADGNPQLTASDRVLGTAVPYVGDFGISKDPQSLAWDQYRMYFTDRQRNAVLRLSQDGLTPISEAGMATFFRNELKRSQYLLGSFDTISGEYNLTIIPPMHVGSASKTVSFDEAAKGWVSFKSFIQDNGLSYSGQYVTVKDHQIWRHHMSKSLTGQVVDRNSFYGQDSVNSSVELVFNASPSSVKSFKTINYEGSQARVLKYDGSVYNAPTGNLTWSESNDVLYPLEPITQPLAVTDNEYFNLSSSDGWYSPGMYTDLQQGEAGEFKNKEGKWFGKITGVQWSNDNLDTNEFTVQGLGINDGYQMSGEAINECLSGCLNANYECVDCEDLLLNDQCTNAAGEVVNCNSPYCVAGPCVTAAAMHVYGCVNPSAVNYNESATIDDGSCEYSVIGCMEVDNPNYNPFATISDSEKCVQGVVTGCMDPVAINYDPAATQDGIYYTEFSSYFEQDITQFTLCYNNCTCFYSITEENTDCDCVVNMCESCCTPGESTWDPVLQYCVQDNAFEVCANDIGVIVDCTSDECASGPCDAADGGTIGCLEGGPNCCTGAQVWSEYTQTCEDIVVGCMDITAINYSGPNLQYQWPNQSATGFDNINGVVYNGLSPSTGTPHPAYNPANTPCSSLEDVDGQLVTTLHTCCEYGQNVEIGGCTDPLSCYYDPNATFDDGSCNYDCIGCQIAWATNYCPTCTQPCFDSNGVANGFDGGNCCSNECIGEECVGCMDPEATNTCVDCSVDDPSLCNYGPEDEECNCDTSQNSMIGPNSCYGCTDPLAVNYNPCATLNYVDVLSAASGGGQSPCIYGGDQICGCMDNTMFNYSPNATYQDESCDCVPFIYGCTDDEAFNAPSYSGNPQVDVNTDDGSCIDVIYGCTDPTMFNYNPLANTSNNSCINFVYGCMDPNALSLDLSPTGGYNPSANANQVHTWNDNSWDGTSNVSTGWILTECTSCQCEYPQEFFEMNVVNSLGDSMASTNLDTNPWLLDPDTTDFMEQFYEDGGQTP